MNIFLSYKILLLLNEFTFGTVCPNGRVKWDCACAVLFSVPTLDLSTLYILLLEAPFTKTITLGSPYLFVSLLILELEELAKEEEAKAEATVEKGASCLLYTQVKGAVVILNSQFLKNGLGREL